MSAPLVSVCVPVAGHARYLAECLESALTQDVDGIEVIVREQGVGAAAPVIAELADKRLRYFRNPRERGVVANRNACLALARGRYVAWLDADDRWLPGSLPDRLGVLETREEVALVHGAAEILDEDGRPLPAWQRPFDRDTVETPDEAFSELVLANKITTSTVVARRSVIQAAGPFVACGATSSDWDMWLRLALRGAVAYRARATACYRQHPASISATVTPARRLVSDRRVIRRVLRAERELIADRAVVASRARIALAARSLLLAQDFHSRGHAMRALRQVAAAVKVAPQALAGSVPGLASSIVVGDAYGWHLRSRAALSALAAALEGTRYGAWLDATSRLDPGWDAAQSRIADAVKHVTPPTAVVATAAKWDPTILRRSGRNGLQFPDRRLMPEGYPADGARAAAHIDELRREGVTHLVLPHAWGWWLERYGELQGRLGTPVHRDDDCSIFEVVDA
ncbi:MAG TPA: glycosyltransferase [Baekduia sp.]|nr:glycosyltransferase [Baekduia sp.]